MRGRGVPRAAASTPRGRDSALLPGMNATVMAAGSASFWAWVPPPPAGKTAAVWSRVVLQLDQLAPPAAGQDEGLPR